MHTNRAFLSDDNLPAGSFPNLEIAIKKNASSANVSQGTKLNSECDELDSEQVGLDSEHHKENKWYVNLIQIMIPFFLAGFGMVGAGLLLDYVQKWELFLKVDTIIVLVPALLGLKGNLEMTLASRLSTQANLGMMNTFKLKTKAVLGNLAVTQIQSIVVGFLASFIACISEFISKDKFDTRNLLTIIGTSVITASVASLVLGTVVMLIIIVSKEFNVNPDNIATPMAASLGDLVTLFILANTGSLIFVSDLAVKIVIIVLFVVVIPFLVIYARKNEFVKETLYHGWLPILLAMIISSMAGVLLEKAIEVFYGIAIYQPVVNGIGGNLVGIFASRLSTALHSRDKFGEWASWAPAKWYLYPLETFFGKQNPEWKTSLILTALILPGHLVFFFTIYAFTDKSERHDLSAVLVLGYLFITFFQVITLLIVCYYLVHLVWRFRKNPDNTCIPLLTALGDFLGVSLLFLCFYVAYEAGNLSLKRPHEEGLINSTNITTSVYTWFDANSTFAYSSETYSIINKNIN